MNKVKFRNTYIGKLGTFYKYDIFNPHEQIIYNLTDEEYELLKDDCEIYNENIIDKIKKSNKRSMKWLIENLN